MFLPKVYIEMMMLLDYTSEAHAQIDHVGQ